MTSEMIDLLLAGDALSTVFQPIFDISGTEYVVWAVEALTRGPAGTHFEQASVLFDYIRLKQEEVAADRHCIASAFAARRRILPRSIPHLTLNVHAGTLERDRDFTAFIESLARRHDIDTNTLVVEIIEQSTYFDSKHLVTALNDLRSLGIQISIDDLGLGHGNYRLILDANPDYLKLDRYFIHRCADDAHRRALIESVQQIAANFGAAVIAEGVERREDLLTLCEMGIPLVQGYLLAAPGAPPNLDVAPSLQPILNGELLLAVERSN
jgi:EAL domain-containing protein (putative c-di-GMP-specific phosphodiesterase class I)